MTVPLALAVAADLLQPPLQRGHAIVHLLRHPAGPRPALLAGRPRRGGGRRRARVAVRASGPQAVLALLVHAGLPTFRIPHSPRRNRSSSGRARARSSIACLTRSTSASSRAMIPRSRASRKSRKASEASPYRRLACWSSGSETERRAGPPAL